MALKGLLLLLVLGLYSVVWRALCAKVKARQLVITQISARRVKGVSKGYESTPPGLERQARLTVLRGATHLPEVRRTS